VIACDAFGGAHRVTTGANTIRVSISHGLLSLFNKDDHDEGPLRRVVPLGTRFSQRLDKSAQGDADHETRRRLTNPDARKRNDARRELLAASLPYHSTPVETQNSFCSGSDILTQRVPPRLCTPLSMR
jgi:hypothetical protein